MKFTWKSNKLYTTENLINSVTTLLLVQKGLMKYIIIVKYKIYYVLKINN